MNGFALIVPMLLVRYALPALVDRPSLARAAHVAPVEPHGRPALLAYQVFTVAVLLAPLALSVRTDGPLFWPGLAVYVAGLALDARATWDFCHPDADGLCRRGLYRFSRNPMYVAYFAVLLGCCLLTASPVLAALLVGFQVSGHALVLAEERWCRETFGAAYDAYRQSARRYL